MIPMIHILLRCPLCCVVPQLRRWRWWSRLIGGTWPEALYHSKRHHRLGIDILSVRLCGTRIPSHLLEYISRNIYHSRVPVFKDFVACSLCPWGVFRIPSSPGRRTENISRSTSRGWRNSVEFHFMRPWSLTVCFHLSYLCYLLIWLLY